MTDSAVHPPTSPTPEPPSADLEATFARWGRPPEPVDLTPAAREFLASEVGVAAPTPPTPVTQVEPPPSRLPEDVRSDLVAVLGSDHVRTDRVARLAHTGGLSYVDLVRRRRGDVSDAPDAVLLPASHDEVEALLAVCVRHGVAVVPFGGGTSVVGGVRPVADGFGAVVSVAFDRMAALLEVDEESLLATVGPGITGPTLERLLAARGLTLGHLPQSWERATIGGYVATRSAGQASSGYGRSDEMVESLRVATPAGSLHLGRAPSSAAGPDLRQLFVGGEGVLGIITEVTLRVRHLPAYSRYEGVMFPSYAAGIAAFRALLQAGLRADVMRLSDEEETAATLMMSGPSGRTGQAFGAYLKARKVEHGSLVILGWEGLSARAVGARRTPAWALLRQHGAVPLGRRVGESWRHGRFSGPFLRDRLMDDGYLVETLETATTWNRLLPLHETVLTTLKGALRSADGGPGPYVMSHVSHVYETGASLYVTVLARADAADPAEQWRAAKRAVGDAIAGSGATITHHHAVGLDHEPWMRAEVGDLGLDVLRAVKATVDPTGILNPGKLIPPRD
ncbi:MAG: FAD-binding oxidoreductase [Candidatus Nanopelagicales bacterium]